MASAVEVFVRGLAILRGLRHPVTVERLDGLWVVRDVPRPRSRVEEWIGQGMSPAEMDRIVRRHRRGRHAISCFRAVDEPDEPLRSGFRDLGYRLHATQPLLRHLLRRIPSVPSPVALARVRTRAMERRWAATWLGRPGDVPRRPPDAPIRDHVACEGGDIVGAAQSVATPAGSWLVDLHVRTLHRRRGIGRALLGRVLRDERARGGSPSVLLASRAGHRLYLAMGYEPVGELLLFTPPRS